MRCTIAAPSDGRYLTIDTMIDMSPLLITGRGRTDMGNLGPDGISSGAGSRAGSSAAQAAMLGPGFTFTYPEQDDRRHLNALANRRQPEPAYVRR
jgi:hypothetical protein